MKIVVVAIYFLSDVASGKSVSNNTRVDERLL